MTKNPDQPETTGRTPEQRELLAAMGGELAQILEERIQRRLPDDASAAEVEAAYPRFRQENPELAAVVDGLKDGTLEVAQIGAFLHAQQGLQKDTGTLKGFMLDMVKETMRERGLPEGIAATGKIPKAIEEQVHALAKEAVSLPDTAADRKFYSSSLQREALYDEVLKVLQDSEVSAALGVNIPAKDGKAR